MALLLVASPTMAQNRFTLVYQVHNNSDACGWFTTYWSYKSEAHWRINQEGGGHPQALAPGAWMNGQITFNYRGLTPQVKVLVQLKDGAKCVGSGDHRIWTGVKDYPADTGDTRQAVVRLTGSRASGYRFTLQ
ncbi:MAG: hypothetical protein ACREMT_00340 [Vulcanimicrobiaceae bacterium]